MKTIEGCVPPAQGSARLHVPADSFPGSGLQTGKPAATGRSVAVTVAGPGATTGMFQSVLGAAFGCRCGHIAVSQAGWRRVWTVPLQEAVEERVSV